MLLLLLCTLLNRPGALRLLALMRTVGVSSRSGGIKRYHALPEAKNSLQLPITRAIDVRCIYGVYLMDASRNAWRDLRQAGVLH